MAEVMQAFEGFLGLLDSWLGSSIWFPYALVGVGIWFTIYLGFPQFRYFNRAWRFLFGKEGDSDAPGDTTHFRALTTALSGTVGTGNIGGVAFALFLGGPAALFWMWVTAFVGMTTKFVEVTLSHKYRVFDDKGEVAGGPMYYMEKRLNMKWLAVIFAFATLLSAIGTGCLPQSNNLANGLDSSFGIPTWVSGLVLAVLLGLVVIGGIKRIAAVASKIVPLMAAFYLIGAIGVIVVHAENIWPSVVSIFGSIFSGSAALGGFLGASFAYAFTHGVNRGIFSNEAGQGSAPIAHASAKAEDPVPEGLVSLLEPFIDTLVICTITGLVILSSGAWADKFPNDFGLANTEVVAGVYTDEDPAHIAMLSAHLGRNPPENNPIKPLTAELTVVNGAIVDSGFTIIHNRSVAENVTVREDGELFTGSLVVEAGEVVSDVELHGDSLVHSVNLTVEAFKRGIFGETGQYAVTVSLVLFAFSTALAWSYYGDRAILYLFGPKALTPYRVIYCIAFLLGSTMDTTLIWKIAAVFVVLMALPNLFGITMLSREMKSTVGNFMNPKEEKAA